jgi:pSer/pThr/pTyr-binding forkhead associated (FHA) protein
VAFFVVEQGNGEDIGKVFTLTPNTALIGRQTNESNPVICLHDSRVSREHAELVYQQGYYYLRDLGSKNGTEIDGERIQPGKLYPVKQNSAIGLGITAEGPCILLRFSVSDETVPIMALPQERRKASPVEWLKVDEERKEVWVDGKPISLSRKEYNLIRLLNHYAGKVCLKDDIIAAVWPEVQDTSGVSDATLDQLIHRLREKIEVNPAQPNRIISKKGFGFMLA